MKSANKTLFIILVLVISSAMRPNLHAAECRTVYMSYILHGNMNYDRYTRPTIWKEFPVIYDNLLTYLDEHPDFKGQLQFSGQTFASLMHVSEHVLEHARRIHERGQLNFTGTFYSEPVNVNMDGPTNYRCAWLGTRIIEDNVGTTDGFYLQERAYHPQLPWILNHSNVSWIPVITNDNSPRPFILKGLDGSRSVCVPITRDDFISVAESAPGNSLITIEEDYEIPQTFTSAYEKVAEFNRTHKDVQIEWITVKEYISRFGLDNERFVGHAAKIDSPENGTYSRWTADPLDIMIQEKTNTAMNLFRIANSLDALSAATATAVDCPLEQSGISFDIDPLAWNIESLACYPEHEKYLQRDGCTTVLSRAEHLLLWAVNSDAKGWFPLYEKRMERLNALENSAKLSRFIINKFLDNISCRLSPAGYDEVFVVMNMEQARKAVFNLELGHSAEAWNVATGERLRSSCRFDGERVSMDIEASLPAYGYTTVGVRYCKDNTLQWTDDIPSISNGKLTLSIEDDSVVLSNISSRIALTLDTFKIKALSEMERGNPDNQWRDICPDGPARVSVCNDALAPMLRIDRQIDHLVHFRQLYTLYDDRLECELIFNFPHPSLVRKVFTGGRTNFRPEGLDFKIETGMKCSIGYDIPFGISEFKRESLSYFCPLSACFAQHAGYGVAISPTSGEQAFSANPATGEITLHLGTSTTSGPIREMGLKFTDPTTVVHDFEWYMEPFHGCYSHKVVIRPYNGSWQSAHVPVLFREASQPVLVRKVRPNPIDADTVLPFTASLIENVPVNVEITGVHHESGNGLVLDLNEREGKRTTVRIKTPDGQIHRGTLMPFGIQNF